MMTERSKNRLKTCDLRLQKLFSAIADNYDIAVIWGHRGQVDQDIAYKQGNSKLPWPRSKHNRYPSQAVDVMPLPINWGDIKGLHDFALVVKDTAWSLGIDITWGGDFKNFFDGAHWELPQ